MSLDQKTINAQLDLLVARRRILVRLLNEWLNLMDVMGLNHKEHTLKNLYDKRPGWLDQVL